MGGAQLAVTSDKPELRTVCEDRGNGTYLVTWSSEVGGLYKVRVTIDGVDVKGSPTSVRISDNHAQRSSSRSEPNYA